MNRLSCTCKYCDHHWYQTLSPYSRLKCPKCGDKNIKSRKEAEKKDVYGYESAPEIDWDFKLSNED